MKKVYFSPVFSLARIHSDVSFCASTNVPGVTTGSQDGLEGWDEDPEVGEWE
ncbi:MAG: hypothetical protein IKP46_09540 [Bacteroidales bacterium]|nr:hypothetical protein [Bacteroidales bacterium]